MSKTVSTAFLPARNALLMSLACAHASGIGADEVHTGLNCVEFSGYPDCTVEFVVNVQGYDACRQSARTGNRLAVPSHEQGRNRCTGQVARDRRIRYMELLSAPDLRLGDRALSCLRRLRPTRACVAGFGVKRDAAFVACSKTKADRPLAAAALYASPLYRKSLLAALDSARAVFILSAEHGVLPLSDRIGPYDTTLKRMPQAERNRWGEKIDATLDLYVPPRSAVNLYCGEEYIAPLRPSFSRLGYSVYDPLVGQSLGQRLQTLRAVTEEEDLRTLKGHFDCILHSLWVGQAGGRLISETTGKQPWPRRGVYFILDSSVAAASGRMPRIVRVGTHAVSSGSKTTLLGPSEHAPGDLRREREPSIVHLPITRWACIDGSGWAKLLNLGRGPKCSERNSGPGTRY